MNRPLKSILAAAAGALAFAAPAQACIPMTTYGVFTKWGDDRPYALLSKVDTNDMRRWALSGGAAATLDDSPYTGDLTDRLSIHMPPGSEAWSPAVCTGSEFTAFRLFARTADADPGGTGPLEVQAILEDGATAYYPGLSAADKWNATPRMSGSLGRYFDVHKVAAVRLRFRNTSTHTYRVDDVHYDPRAKQG